MCVTVECRANSDLRISLKCVELFKREGNQSAT